MYVFRFHHVMLLLCSIFAEPFLSFAEITSSNEKKKVSLVSFIEEAVALVHPDRALFQQMKSVQLSSARPPRTGTMSLSGHSYSWSHRSMRTQLKNSGKRNRGWIKHDKLLGVTRGARDELPYFVHGYLQGFSPFKITHPDEARKALAYHMSYIRDENHYKRDEVYVTSEEAFLARKGDCEDHAMLLADWLVTEGYDARVVIGKKAEEGHVWVALFWNDTVYNIESTAKTVKPLRTADAFKTFIPRYMFNAGTLWQYVGPEGKNDYTSSSWNATAIFTEDKASTSLPVKKVPHISKKSVKRTASGPAVILATTELIDAPKYVAHPIRRLYAGEAVTILRGEKNWYKIRTRRGDLGYVLKQDID